MGYVVGVSIDMNALKNFTFEAVASHRRVYYPHWRAHHYSNKIG